MRKLIAGMKVSADERIEGPDGFADWVDTWADDYGVMEEVDACLLGAGMYPGYEQYWTAVQNASDQPLPMTGRLPTPEEMDWARFAARTPHYVLSGTLTLARWSNTRFLRRPEDVAALKREPGRNIYLIGGAQTTSSLIEAGLVDELRLIVHPLIAGGGKALFATTERRRDLELRSVRELEGGRVSLVYGIR